MMSSGQCHLSSYASNVSYVISFIIVSSGQCHDVIRSVYQMYHMSYHCVIRAQLEDTKARVVVVASKALPAYMEANARLAEEDRVQHILILDAEPGQELPPGVSSFRALYQDDGSQCPETLPGEAASEKYQEYQ